MTAQPAWSLFGLVIRSDLPLPFEPVKPGDATMEEDVSVAFGAIPAGAERMAACGPGELQFEAPGTGRFRISDGRQIVIDPAPGASERNLCLFLLGSAFGALLHQRGLLPLHANAVLIGGCAVAFMGASGAGKSTLAAWFQDRGHTVLADDVCAVSLKDGTPLVLPGVPRLRLWEDALERSGRSTAEFERSFDGRDKFDVPSAPGASSAAAPLGAIYLLGEGDGDEMTIAPLTGSSAVEALIANTYRGRCVPLIGATARHFGASVELARQVPLHLASRRKDAAAFERTAEALERHATGLLAHRRLAPA